ncbi:MAG: hypothetical protein PF961_22870 [Planctomycetota bacterium]|jgi:hypothetical protein|nr:hypothetical protein [Planctomycetota bacterium]
MDSASDAASDSQELSRTGHVPASPLDYTIEMRATIDRGVEVVVYLINTIEEEVHVTGVTVEHLLDGASHGRHEVYFHAADRRGHLCLEQFVPVEGHYHIQGLELGDAEQLHARVYVDFLSDGRDAQAAISKRLTTKIIRRAAPSNAPGRAEEL